MKTFFLLLAMLILSINLHANPPDSCLKYYFHSDPTFTNHDSVMVDSCDGSPTYGRYYGKKYFYVKFNYNIIPRELIAPADTIIEYIIDSIDIKYTDAINDFTHLQSIYGNFKFREIYPNLPDTTIALPRVFKLLFSNFVPIKQVEDELNNFSCIEIAGFVSWFGVESDVDESISDTDEILLFPNPVSDFLTIQSFVDLQAQSFSIFNTFGQKLYEGELKAQIDVSSLTPGVYYIKIGSKLEKFVKM